VKVKCNKVVDREPKIMNPDCVICLWLPTQGERIETQCCSPVTRVTRLGEFSPKVWLLTLGSGLKITKAANFYGVLFPMVPVIINLTKNGLGYILGDFFTNSSGHPACHCAGTGVMITIFCDFWQFSAKKLAFFSKTDVMIKFLHNLALFWVKNANFFAEFFGENVLKIITSVTG
jgi:hypothetical protein